MLNPWYDMAVSARGRTTVGISGLAVEDAVGLIARFLDGEVPDNPRGDVKLSETLKLAVDDVKAFYREAAAAQPGRNTGNEVNDWFYGETAAGRALFALKPRLAALAEETGDGFYKTFGSLLLIPRSQAHRAPAR